MKPPLTDVAEKSLRRYGLNRCECELRYPLAALESRRAARMAALRAPAHVGSAKVEEESQASVGASACLKLGAQRSVLAIEVAQAFEEIEDDGDTLQV